MKRFWPICRRFHSLSSRYRAMVVTHGRPGVGGYPADETIGESSGPARLASGSGLAVVTATAPS